MSFAERGGHLRSRSTVSKTFQKAADIKQHPGEFRPNTGDSPFDANAAINGGVGHFHFVH